MRKNHELTAVACSNYLNSDVTQLDVVNITLTDNSCTVNYTVWFVILNLKHIVDEIVV